MSLKFECNISNEYKDEKCCDFWGAAFAWNGTIGAEYNFCVDDGINYSAFYKMEYDADGENYTTDHDSNISYEIDFTNEDWEAKLENAMINTLKFYSDGVPNYYAVKSMIPWKQNYIYMDLPEYVADKIFAKHNLKVKFGGEFVKEGDKYVIVRCAIAKKDKGKFIAAMNELTEKMLRSYRFDYVNKCEEVAELLVNNKEIE